MSKYNNLVHAKDAMIRMMAIALGALSLFLVLALLGWMRSPSDIRLHYPPDLREGAALGLNEVPVQSVYTFTYYMFQQLNRWPNDGAKDYFNRIHTFKDFMTPVCFQEKLSDYEARNKSGSLLGRERAVWEIPGRGFSHKRVKQISGDTWTVGLDLHVQETHRGETVKDRLIHYPLRVVRYNVDPELNPFGLALDCYVSKPRVIEVKESANVD